jgi:hypothetical protein
MSMNAKEDNYMKKKHTPRTIKIELLKNNGREKTLKLLQNKEICCSRK